MFVCAFLSLFTASSLEKRHYSMWRYRGVFTVREEETAKVRNMTALHPVCFCLQHVRAKSGCDQTFTKNKNTRGIEGKAAGMRVRCLKFWVKEYVVKQVCVYIYRQRSGEVGSRCHRVRVWACRYEPGRFSSTRPAPAAKGVTAEYTWPGSFRTSRDNWERLPPRLQRELTKGIMCGGKSTQSNGDSVNVWLRYHAEVSVCTFMLCVRIVEALGRQEEAYYY